MVQTKFRLFYRRNVGALFFITQLLHKPAVLGVYQPDKQKPQNVICYGFIRYHKTINRLIFETWNVIGMTIVHQVITGILQLRWLHTS